jgi:lambda repressor-like predicted transcriptional regulator
VIALQQRLAKKRGTSKLDVDRAAFLYVHKGLTLEEIAKREGVSDTTVLVQLRQAGVPLRDSRTALKQKALRTHGTSRPLPMPRPCACGCGQMTSGIPHKRSGQWTYPEWVQGHRGGAPSTVRRLRMNVDESPCREWIELVQAERTRKGWTLARLGREAGVSYQSLIYTKRPKPEFVVAAADALDIDRRRALVSAGYAVPSPLGWKILEFLTAGGNRGGLSRHAGVHHASLWTVLCHPERPVADRVVHKLANAMGLPLQERGELLAAMDRLRRRGGRQPTPINEDELRRMVQAYGVGQRAARHFGVSVTTIHFRALKLDLATGIHRTSSAGGTGSALPADGGPSQHGLRVQMRRLFDASQQRTTRKRWGPLRTSYPQMSSRRTTASRRKRRARFWPLFAPSTPSPLDTPELRISPPTVLWRGGPRMIVPDAVNAYCKSKTGRAPTAE